MINRRDFLKTTGLATLPFAASMGLGSQNGFSASRKPNIIFILADDLGYGDLSCYGQKQFETPVLDRMAAEGIRFTDCYSGNTVCAPSRCSLMTGYHSGHARIRANNNIPLLPEDKTVAAYLKELGYTTGIIGKWGLGEAETTGIPNKQGFDYWYGYLNQVKAHNYYPETLWRNEKLEFLKTWSYSPDVFTEEALSFVRKNKENPFFLYLTYIVPHAFNEGQEQGMPVPSDKPYSDKNWPQNEKNFAAMIHRMDGDIGKIMQLLKELGLDEDTIVFFSSDNGPHKEGGHSPDFFDSNGPLRGIKRDLYEGGIRVPMIARWPGKIKAGVVNHDPLAFWDFLPTSVELAGGPVPEKTDGLSMGSTLLGTPQKGHEFFYWEFHEGGFKQAVRMGEWKAVVNNSDPLELYNLLEDISETRNVADQHPDIVQKIQDYLKTARSEDAQYPIVRKK